MEEVSIEEFSTVDFSSSTNASSNDSSNLKEFSADEFLGEKKKNPLMGYDVFIYSLFTFIAPIFFIIAAHHCFPDCSPLQNCTWFSQAT